MQLQKTSKRGKLIKFTRPRFDGRENCNFSIYKKILFNTYISLLYLFVKVTIIQRQFSAVSYLSRRLNKFCLLFVVRNTTVIIQWAFVYNGLI